MEPSVVANEQTGWQSVDRFPLLREDELQVWRVELTDGFDWAGMAMPYLSNQEGARADRRLAGRGREEFVAGRACLRALLGQVFGIAPLLVPLTENAYGKPEFAGQRIYFNVSHTKGNVLIAMTTKGAVGVDVEHIDPHMDVAEIASTAFTQDEFERLGSIVSEEERRVAFYRCWTRKEAVAKADGRGLSLDLYKIPVPVSVVQLTPVQVRVQGEETSREYLLRDIPLAQSVVGAVAVESHNCRVSWLDFPHSLLDGTRQNN